jgi:single-strand DNA-binding protein
MINVTVFEGHLGRDAELRRTKSGEAVLSLSAANTEKFTTRDGEKRETTTWLRGSVWGKRAEAIAQYLTKGTQVRMQGKLQEREWSKDGVTQKSVELRVEDISWDRSGGAQRSEGNGSNRKQQPAQSDMYGDDYGEDDCPF